MGTDHLLFQLSASGRRYARALSKFIKEQRVAFALDLVQSKFEQEEEWKSYGLEPLDHEQQEKLEGDQTPEEIIQEKAACITNGQFTVWTSMLRRAMETANYFDPDEYDIKHIRFLNEINAAVSNQIFTHITFSYLFAVCSVVKEWATRRYRGVFQPNLHSVWQTSYIIVTQVWVASLTSVRITVSVIVVYITC